MCGIAGILARGGPPPSFESLAAMVGALLHRGPDEQGAYRGVEIGLAHARLSIVDVAAGQQPMASTDGDLVVAYNGEIYNHVELRRQLAGLGFASRTASDTEVVLSAYAAWGDAAFARFNGQFAIALWSERARSLTLARDAFGVRPLYVAERGHAVLFASEVKAIFAAAPDMPRALDPVGIAETFTFWTVVPPQSVFVGVEELRPGHVRTYSPSGVREHAFVSHAHPRSRAEEFQGSFEDAAVALREALARATSLRMLRADVPVGSYLSGGLDSSIVAALGLRAKGARFRTFSMRFADAEYDETPFQALMAEALGTEHTSIEVSRRDIANAFPEVVRHAERPLLRTAPAPLYLLSRLVQSTGTKVVLTGEGADELFGGYDLFREAKVRRFWARHPSSRLRPLLLDRLYPWLARSPVSDRAVARRFFGRDLADVAEPDFAHRPRWRSAQALFRLFSPEQREASTGIDVVARLLASLPAAYSEWSPLARDQHLEIRTLLSGYLLSSQGDRMLMANHVEGRFPFLDKDVVALADSLPDAFKLHVLEEKHVLKRAAGGLVPRSILERTKQPYRAPDALSFAGKDAPDWIADLTTEAATARAAVFAPRAVAQLFAKLRARRGEASLSNADNMAVVSVLSTHLLHETMVRRAPARREVSLRTLIDRTTPCP